MLRSCQQTRQLQGVVVPSLFSTEPWVLVAGAPPAWSQPPASSAIQYLSGGMRFAQHAISLIAAFWHVRCSHRV